MRLALHKPSGSGNRRRKAGFTISGRITPAQHRMIPAYRTLYPGKAARSSKKAERKPPFRFVRRIGILDSGWFYAWISIASVPATISARPNAAFFVSRSCSAKQEKAIVTRMLSLSTGTTTLASPSCSAL